MQVTVREMNRQVIPPEYSRRHQMCDFIEHATSAPAELGMEIHNVSRNRARTQVILQAQKLHVYHTVTTLWFVNLVMINRF